MKKFNIPLTEEMQQALQEDKEISIAFLDENGNQRVQIKIKGDK